MDAATGIITTVAGTYAPLAAPYGLAFDGRGDLYISDGRADTVRKVNMSTGEITTVVPVGLQNTLHIAVDGDGNIFMSDPKFGQIWKRDAATGTIRVVANAKEPAGLAVDGAGNLYIAEPPGCRVSRMDRAGVVTTIAGIGCSFQVSGDGGPALLGGMQEPVGVAVAPWGDIYVADFASVNSVRVLSPSGGGGCSIQVSPTSLTSSTSATNLAVSIQAANPGCSWSLIGQPAWITPSSYSGFGSGTLTLAVAPNIGPAQSASFLVAERPVEVSQDGACSWSLSPSTQTFGAEGGSGTVRITGCPGVPWIVSAAADWLSGDRGIWGVGNGRMAYGVPANQGDARSATLMVGGVPFQVVQTAAGTTSPGLRFRAVAPCRIADTRDPDGPFGGPTMTAGATRSFPVPRSACGIPAAAQAYSLNVTVVPRGMLPYLTLWPTGRTQPLVSTLNAWNGEVVSNAAIVPAGSEGSIDVFAAGATDVILDVNGYFDSSDNLDYGGSPCASSGSCWFYPVTPCRWIDTRTAQGPSNGGSLSSYETRDLSIDGWCGVPYPAGGVSLNVTAVPSAGYLGYLTIWAGRESRPNVSTLNSWEGKVVANAAIVPGSYAHVFVTEPADVILDVNGYFARRGLGGDRDMLAFYPLTPCRVADTRGATGPFGGPIMQAGETRSFAVPASGCGVPATAGAYALNITVVPEGPLSYLTTWPTGSAQPFVSTLNSFDGSVVANAAIVPAGTDGAISVYVTDRTHVIVDINGYFAP